MRLLAVMFALILVLATASQAMACGAGGGHKDGDKAAEDVKS